MISIENAGTVIIEGEFLSAVYKKYLGSNSVLWQFCRYWVHNGFSDIRGKLTEDSKLKARLVQISKQTAEDCPGIKLNGQSLEIVESFVILVTQWKLEGVHLTVYNRDQE